mgnify:FL=1
MSLNRLITVAHLTKDYRTSRRREGVRGGLIDLLRPQRRVVRAVEDVSFTIDEGEMVGYIGANGAGKSTTIKMLTGILTPTAGEVRVGGLVPYEERQRYTRHIGVVFGQRTQLWWDLAVVESLRLLKKIYEVDDALYEAQLALFDDLLQIRELLHQPVRKLSLGQRMRCDLAAALLHRPRILFLDEPTIGLDVVAKQSVRNFLKETRDRLGTTVILTTHDLGDIQELCRRIMIIDHGRLLFDGTIDELRGRVGDRVRVRVELWDPAPASALAECTTGLPVKWEEHDGQEHAVEFSRRDVRAAEVIRHVVNARRVHDISIQEPTIEEVVRQIYRTGVVAGTARSSEASPHD